MTLAVLLGSAGSALAAPLAGPTAPSAAGDPHSRCAALPLLQRVVCDREVTEHQVGIIVAFLVHTDMVLQTSHGAPGEKDKPYDITQAMDAWSKGTLKAEDVRSIFYKRLETLATIELKSLQTISTIVDVLPGITAITMASATVAKDLPKVNAALETANKGMDVELRGLKQIQSGLNQANKGIGEAKAAMAQTNAGIAEANTAIQKVNAALDATTKSVASVDKGLRDAFAGFKPLASEGLLHLDLSQLEKDFPQAGNSLFADAIQGQVVSSLLDFLPGIGSVKGFYEGITGYDKVTGLPLDTTTRVMAGIPIIGAIGKDIRSGKHFEELLKLREFYDTWEKAGPLINSLRKSGKLPVGYITQDEAMKLGWDKGKALANSAPGKSLGGDVYRNETNLLPPEPGRTWYEADVGQDYKLKRKNNPGTRLVYSSDGLMYITVDHYANFHNIGRWKK
ncbi:MULTISPECIES: ribonuclease domain-containing protein [unclassified Streptomyces]|uniref:pre-toxin TG domain-containing protein n=1 Tax=unclassified Streptomyces TaxID=2593676 RepID=UPI0013C63CFC|nr:MULTISPECIES: ribonuclease domain-containing protein [unclassified Streptomyces]NEA72720.1 hypothetical protein [Streptomyces sp. SID13588]